MDQYKTIISAYSLKQNEVGNPIEGTGQVLAHSDGVSALLCLDEAFSTYPRKPEQGLCFMIELPGGQRVAFDQAYQEIFGEPPVRRESRENRYPQLEKLKRQKTQADSTKAAMSSH